jgi:predicted enzyme related to lactoylglutathione lyase
MNDIVRFPPESSGRLRQPRALTRRGFFAGDKRESRDLVKHHGRFVWYELMTTDMAAAKAFYADVVGWGTQDASMPGMAYTLFTAGKSSVGGVVDLPEDARKLGMRPSWLGYVSVNDVAATAARIKRLGGTVYVEPTDIPNISRICVAVDPQMAMIALIKWLTPGQEPAALSTPGRVGWHELLAADREQAFAFYAELFGWQKADADTGAVGTYQLFSAGGETIGGMFTKQPEMPAPYWLYYFNVGDIDVAMRRVKAGGGGILSSPVEVPGGSWVVQCTDPQSAIFALSGKRANDGIGYFERAASRDPADVRFGLRKRTDSTSS